MTTCQPTAPCRNSNHHPAIASAGVARQVGPPLSLAEELVTDGAERLVARRMVTNTLIEQLEGTRYEPRTRQVVNVWA